MAAEPPILDEIIGKEGLKKRLETTQRIFTDLAANYSGNKEDYFKRLKLALTNLEDSLTKASSINTATSRFDEIRHGIEDLDSLATGFDGQAAHFDRLKDLTDKVLLLLPQLNTLEIPVKRDHEASLEKHLVEFVSQGKKKIEEIENIKNHVVEKFEGSLKDIIADAMQSRDRITTLLSESENVAHIYTGGALSKVYDGQATKHNTEGQLWTGRTLKAALITVGALSVFFGYQVYQALGNPNEQLNISLITTKVLITVALGLLTRWMSKRASHHLALESQYRRLALNLATIDSYTANLDETTRHRLQAYIGAHIFASGSKESVDSDFDSFKLAEVLKSIAGKESVVPPEVKIL